jgi:hypothetical protein
MSKLALIGKSKGSGNVEIKELKKNIGGRLAWVFLV